MILQGVIDTLEIELAQDIFTLYTIPPYKLVAETWQVLNEHRWARKLSVHSARVDICTLYRSTRLCKFMVLTVDILPQILKYVLRESIHNDENTEKKCIYVLKFE